jgi:hypothetical protein
MAAVAIIARPPAEGTRQALVLTEDRLGDYPEFRDFFVRTFDLDQVGLSEPGFLRAPSGTAYALVFVGRSGEPFPSGLEVYAIVEALEPWTTSWLTRTCGLSSAGWSAASERRGRSRTFTRRAACIVFRRRDNSTRKTQHGTL